jgi:hypothetical protein
VNPPTVAPPMPEAPPATVRGSSQPQQSSRQQKAAFQDGVTIVARIKPGAEESLLELLRRIGADIEGNEVIPFPRLRAIHFARWLVLEASRDARGRPTPASLIFSSNFDGTVEAHLNELYDEAATGLNLIYSHCEGYPAEDRRSRAAVLRYLSDHDLGYNTLYVGTRGRTVGQIRQEADLRERIEGFLDQASRQPEFLRQSPEKIREAIQQFVLGEPDLRWAAQPPPVNRKAWPTRRDILPFTGLAAILLGLGAIWFNTSGWSRLLVPLLPLGALGMWLVVLRRKESTDEQFPAVTDFAHVGRLAQQEDRFVQNQMSAVNNIKPGAFRLTTLRLVLSAIDIAGRYIYTKGSLGSIPSIHFARWVVVDEGRRLVFFSNFDGSWENYLGDFIDKAAVGLTAVWSNTYGFPRSRFLGFGGATDEQRFKAYARNSQVVTQVWYTAYKWLSVQNINNNSAIRAGLFASLTRDDVSAWLRRL